MKEIQPNIADKEALLQKSLHLFNTQFYYEAHEELENLWHPERPNGRLAAFYKGLIQVAGAFTQLKLHYLDPLHKAHKRRLHPAGRLFGRAVTHLSPFAPCEGSIDVDAVIALCEKTLSELELSSYNVNPWSPESCVKISYLPTCCGGNC